MSMNSIVKTILISLLIVGISSCEFFHPPTVKMSLVMVDSISAPEVVKAHEPFDIGFYGVVGYNGCYDFSHFKVKKKDTIINIEAWARYESMSNICPDIMKYLHNSKLKYKIEDSGIYTLKVKKTHGEFLEKKINVE